MERGPQKRGKKREIGEWGVGKTFRGREKKGGKKCKLLFCKILNKVSLGNAGPPRRAVSTPRHVRETAKCMQSLTSGGM